MENNQNPHNLISSKAGVEGLFLKIRFIVSQYLHGLKIVSEIKKKAKRGEQINVIFILIHGSVWPYERLYRKFKSDKRFNTQIIIAPYTLYGKAEMMKTLEETKKLFCDDMYNSFVAYDEEKDEYIDIKTKFNPDIVFFTNPHSLTEADYSIDHFWKDSLTCYVPYGIYAANIQNLQFNQQFHNVLWRHFLPSQLHQKMAIKYAYNKGMNTVVTGYPKCDIFIGNEHNSRDPWKKVGKQLKKVIWAPHHTIEDNSLELGYSTFEIYSESMLELADKYKHKLQFALKPHPLLWMKLKQEKGWSESRITQYRNLWKNGGNTQLEEGEYLELFIHSDGLILDSISFISEYMYLNKPHLFLAKNANTGNKFNEYGKLVYDLMYEASNRLEVERFIERVIIRGDDYLSSNRDRFTQKYLIPQNKQLASDMIYKYIAKTIL